MEERHAEVLKEIVEEYIRLARPVGSASIAEALPWPTSSATIRTMMHALEVDGYIYQPHTSAGRIPTDRGYRYYVDHQRNKRVTDGQVERIRDGYNNMAEEYRHVNRTLAKLVAYLSQSMAVSYNVKAQDVQEAGFKQLLDQPDGYNPAAVREVSDFLENVDEYLVQLAPADNHTAVILIGEENRLFNAKYLSLILRTIPLGSRESVIIAIIGPKRMPYGRHVGLLEGVARAMEEEL